MDQFINNKVTVNYNMSGDVVFRYSRDEMFDMMAKEVAQEFGKYAIKKSKRTIHEKAGSLEQLVTHSCYIFSEQDLQAFMLQIKTLEDENRWLRFEQNRRQAGHFDNI
jgi:hypothetical protein